MSDLQEHISQLKMLKEKFGVYDPAFVALSQVTMAAHLPEIEGALDRIAELQKQLAVSAAQSDALDKRLAELGFAPATRSLIASTLRQLAASADKTAAAPQPQAAQSEDGERLNWLEQQDGRFYNIDKITAIVGVGFNRLPTLRAAIDAALAQAGKEQKNA